MAVYAIWVHIFRVRKYNMKLLIRDESIRDAVLTYFIFGIKTLKEEANGFEANSCD